MSELWQSSPYGERDEGRLLDAMLRTTRHHLEHCEPYRRIWPDFRDAARLEELPWLHVGLFKRLSLVSPAPGVESARALLSSSTSGAEPARIPLDAASSERQSESTAAILREWVGDQRRPLVVLDGARSLRRPREVSARIAAALSLKPMASSLHFAIDDPDRDPVLDWDKVARALDEADEARSASILVYGFTWILWLAWARAEVPRSLAARLARTRVHFVHSGGWKKLEAARVEPERFERGLLEAVHPDSRVVDFYGLVEQVGVLFPLCESGARHVPAWAAAIVRDPWTLAPLAPVAPDEAGERGVGQLQLMNPLPLGGPYHSVLTEDRARLLAGPCSCGRAGQRFELRGRVPRSEVRGCANV